MRERQEEAEELRKVMEATERMRKEELQRDMERLKERRNTADNLLSSNSTPNLMGTSLGSKPIDISGFDIHMKLSADHSSALSSVGSAPTPITSKCMCEKRKRRKRRKHSQHNSLFFLKFLR